MALCGGASKRRSGGASRADRRDVLPHRGPGVPVDAQLPAPQWPSRPLGLAEPLDASDGTLRPYWVLDGPQDGDTSDLAKLDGAL